MTKTMEYISDAIARIENGSVSSDSGSHVAGMFGRAVKGFEKEVRSFVHELLTYCNLDYEPDMRTTIRRRPLFAKTTLGELITVLEYTLKLKEKCASRLIPGTPSDFIKELWKINGVWVEMKHGDEVDGAVLLNRMKRMLTLLQDINRNEHDR